MKDSPHQSQYSPAELITRRIAEIGGWRAHVLAEVRRLIRETDPEIVEEWKWEKATSPGVPVWSCDGILCTGEPYRAVVKLTFARGASLADPARLFNASLEGKVRRAIDIREGEQIDPSALQALVREAVALNRTLRSSRSGTRRPRS
jgi:hypothetical protein